MELYIYALTITARDGIRLWVYFDEDEAKKAAKGYMSWRDDVEWKCRCQDEWTGCLRRGEVVIEVSIDRKKVLSKYEGDWGD